MSQFKGFKSPEYTQIPNEMIDEVMSKITPPEFKVLIYIARRTIGFHKDIDHISIKQLTEGVLTASGKRLDYGTGLSKTTIKKCLNSLIQNGYIIRIHRANQFGVSLSSSFKLKFYTVYFPAKG